MDRSDALRPNAATAAVAPSELAALAFCAADLFLILDSQSTIALALGDATAVFGCATPALAGKTLTDCLAGADRTRLADLLLDIHGGTPVRDRLIEVGSAPSQLRLRLSGQPHPSRPGHACLSVRRDAAEVAGSSLGNREELIVAAIRRARAHGRDGALHLSLIEVHPCASAAWPLLEARIATLLAQRADDGAAARLGETRFGLVHRPAPDIGSLADEIQTLGACAVSATALALDGDDIPPDDAARALRLAIDRFARGGVARMPHGSLQDCVAALIGEATCRQGIGRHLEFLERQGFGLVFQPIVDLRTTMLHHQEALCRFGKGGSPARTLAMTERVGLVADLDLAVTARVIALLRDRPDIAPVSVNLSARSLGSDIFVAQLTALLDSQTAADRARLMFELTETHRVTDLDRIGRVLALLRRGGHRVAIDDFGAGAAAIHCLRRLPADAVKIDGTYTAGLAHSRRDAAFVRAIVGLCEELRVLTVAEMVETVEQAAQLRAAGVTLAQGFLFGRPVDELRRPAQVRLVETTPVRPNA